MSFKIWLIRLILGLIERNISYPHKEAQINKYIRVYSVRGSNND